MAPAALALTNPYTSPTLQDTNPLILRYAGRPWTSFLEGWDTQDDMAIRAALQQQLNASWSAGGAARWRLVVGHHPVKSLGQHCQQVRRRGQGLPLGLLGLRLEPGCARPAARMRHVNQGSGTEVWGVLFCCNRPLRSINPARRSSTTYRTSYTLVIMPQSSSFWPLGSPDVPPLGVCNSKCNCNCTTIGTCVFIQPLRSDSRAVLQDDAYDCQEMDFLRPQLQQYRVAAYVNGHDHDQQLIKVRLGAGGGGEAAGGGVRGKPCQEQRSPVPNPAVKRPHAQQAHAMPVTLSVEGG